MAPMDVLFADIGRELNAAVVSLPNPVEEMISPLPVSHGVGKGKERARQVRAEKQPERSLSERLTSEMLRLKLRGDEGGLARGRSVDAEKGALRGREEGLMMRRGLEGQIV